MIFFVNSLCPTDAICRQIGGNIALGDGLVLDCTKPLPETMLTSSVRCRDIHLGATSQEIHQSLITQISQISLKITCLKFHPDLWGVNELISIPLPFITQLFFVHFQWRAMPSARQPPSSCAWPANTRQPLTTWMQATATRKQTPMVRWEWCLSNWIFL